VSGKSQARPGIGDIGRCVLDNLLPARRLRVSPRIVNARSPNTPAKGPNINWRSYQATLNINILSGPGP
jgi:hypothetical protein